MADAYTGAVRALPPRLLALSVVVVLAAGCTSSASPGARQSDEPGEPVVVSANVDDGATGVPVDTLVDVTAAHGSVTAVSLRSTDGESTVKGEPVDGGWKATGRLEPGSRYRLKVTAEGDDGATRTTSSVFRTQRLSLDEQTYPSVAPLEGEKVGVGMPVIVTFDLPVKDRAAFERQMKVISSPAVEGSWSWFSDR